MQLPAQHRDHGSVDAPPGFGPKHARAALDTSRPPDDDDAPPGFGAAARNSSGGIAAVRSPPPALQPQRTPVQHYSTNELTVILHQMSSQQLTRRPKDWTEDGSCAAAQDELTDNVTMLTLLLKYLRERPAQMPAGLVGWINARSADATYAGSGIRMPNGRGAALAPPHEQRARAAAAGGANGRGPLHKQPSDASNSPPLRPIKTTTVALGPSAVPAANAAAAGATRGLPQTLSPPRGQPPIAQPFAGLASARSPAAAPAPAPARTPTVASLPDDLAHLGFSDPDAVRQQQQQQQQGSSLARTGSSAATANRSAAAAATQPLLRSALSARSLLLQQLLQCPPDGAGSSSIKWLVQLPGFAGALGPYEPGVLSGWLLQGRGPRGLHKQAVEAAFEDPGSLLLCGVPASANTDDMVPGGAFFKPLERLLDLPAARLPYTPAAPAMLSPPAGWNDPAAAPAHHAVAGSAASTPRGAPDASTPSGLHHAMSGGMPHSSHGGAGGPFAVQGGLSRLDSNASTAMSEALHLKPAGSTAATHTQQAVTRFAPDSGTAHSLVAALLSTQQQQPQDRAAMAAAAAGISAFASRSSADRQRLVAAGAVPAIVALLNSPALPLSTADKGEPRLSAANALFSLAGGASAASSRALSEADAITQESLAAAGCIEALTALLAGAWRVGGSSGALAVDATVQRQQSDYYQGLLDAYDDCFDEYGMITPRSSRKQRAALQQQHSAAALARRPTSGSKEQQVVAARWQHAAAQALAALAPSPRVKEIIAADGCAALPRLIRLLGSSTEGVVIAALAALVQLMGSAQASSSLAINQAVFAAGAVPMIAHTAASPVRAHAWHALRILKQLVDGLPAAAAAADEELGGSAIPAAGARVAAALSVAGSQRAGADSEAVYTEANLMRQMLHHGLVHTLLKLLQVSDQKPRMQQLGAELLNALTNSESSKKAARLAVSQFEECSFDAVTGKPRVVYDGVAVVARLKIIAKNAVVEDNAQAVFRGLSEAGLIGRGKPRAPLQA